MTREEREKAIDVLDNMRGMIEDNQGNDYDFALKKGIEALKHEQGSDEMTVAEYRHRMMQTFLDTDCDELIALCVLPTKKDFEHLEWLLKNYYKQEEPCEEWLKKNYYKQELCEDCVSRKAVFETIDDCDSDGLTGIFCSYDDGERFKKYIKELPSVTPTQKWISTSEKLPRKNEHVGNVDKHYLIQDEFGDMQVAAYTNRGWIPIHTIGAFEYDVVAWQPLPKPYEEEKECEE